MAGVHTRQRRVKPSSIPDIIAKVGPFILGVLSMLLHHFQK